MPRLTVRAASELLLIALVTIASSGCNVIGYAAQAVAGTTKVPAAFTLPARTTLVLAERYGLQTSDEHDADALARYVSDELRNNNAASLVDPTRVYELRTDRASRDAFRGMTVAAVGEKLGADQVIYINLISCEVTTEPGTDMLRGRGMVTVKVVEAHTGATLWPTDAEQGHPIDAQTRLYSPREKGVSEPSVRTLVHRQLADQVARLFYAYSVE